MKKRDDLLQGPKGKAIEALDRNDKEQTLQYIDELYEEFRPIHDRYVESINSLLTFVSQRLGEEAVADAAWHYVEQTTSAMFSQMKAFNHEQLVKTLADLHRKHYSRFYIEEDSDKTVITVAECNVGARLLKDGVAQREGGLTKKAWNWSFNRTGVPYYCIHAHVFNNLFQRLGVPIAVEWGRQYDDGGNATGEPCRYVIRKTI
ncbi:MAG: hypothetical protein AMJ70_03615 [Dehalococcoidia bacterium SG8_51_3]|nr:MAG: hypothetical protein AMJ70_03615 [Dehalococcoidia bacterium SG8_51_3]